MSSTVSVPDSRTGRRPSSRQLELESRLLAEHSANPTGHTRSELVRVFTPFATSFVRRYHATREETEDLTQVAALGLLNAIDRYNPDRGPFKSFAAPTILGELRHHLRDRGFSMRMPRRLQDLIMKLNSISADLSEQLGREPTVKELAECCGLDLEEVVEALEAKNARNTVSLNSPVDGEETLQGVDALPTAELGYDSIEATIAADGAGLNRRELRAMELYYERGMTQSEVGDLMGVSQMQVSRVLRAALDKLLCAVRAADDGPAIRRDDASAPRRASRRRRDDAKLADRRPG